MYILRERSPSLGLVFANGKNVTQLSLVGRVSRHNISDDPNCISRHKPHLPVPQKPCVVLYKRKPMGHNRRANSQREYFQIDECGQTRAISSVGYSICTLRRTRGGKTMHRGRYPTQRDDEDNKTHASHRDSQYRCRLLSFLERIPSRRRGITPDKLCRSYMCVKRHYQIVLMCGCV